MAVLMVVMTMSHASAHRTGKPTHIGSALLDVVVVALTPQKGDCCIDNRYCAVAADMTGVTGVAAANGKDDDDDMFVKRSEARLSKN